MRPLESLDARSSELFERGLRDLESRFDPSVGLVRSPFQSEKHQPHPSIWYAHGLLARSSEGDAALAEGMIRSALALQETRESDPHYGNFRWFLEDDAVIDLNAAQFVLEALAHLLLRVEDRLSVSLRDTVCQAMSLAFCEAERLDVHWTYTNIYLLDVQNRILGGQLLDQEKIRAGGESRLREWVRQTKEAGAPHEFNSPTYAAVQINTFATIAQFAKDQSSRQLAVEMEQFLWRHVAKYWHASTMQLGGPHSRAYRRDVTGAPGFLKVLLYKLVGEPRLLSKTPYYSGPDTEGEVQVALTEYHFPPDAARMFREPDTRDVREQVGSSMVLSARVTPEFVLGTMSRPYSVDEPPEPWPMQDSCIVYYAKPRPPGYGIVYCRYRINAGPVGTPSGEAAPPWLDIWDDGVFRVEQMGGRVLVAYGLSPRGQRPITGLRLDIRLIGFAEEDDLLVANRPYHGQTVEMAPGDAMAAAAGDVYCGVVPLGPTNLGHSPPLVLWRDGDELVLSIVNYEGPAKVFWEYRSLGGPFFKGNVKNGFALWVAPRSAFPRLDDFNEALTSVPLGDRTSNNVRRIVWGADADQLVLEYDLVELRP